MAKKKTRTETLSGPLKPPLVVSRHGGYRFQRGILIAKLLRWGLPMEQATEAVGILRSDLLGTDQISAGELLEQAADLVRERYGFERQPPRAPATRQRLPLMRGPMGLMPFSRGILVRRLVAAGLSTEDAIDAADTVGNRLAQLGQTEVRDAEIEPMVEDVLAVDFGPAYARRYRVTTFVRQSERPLLLLVGGAVGTGKSTLATELAYRLGIRKVTSTDMIRETMRTVLSPEVVPGLHDHSFRGMLQGGGVLSDPRERVLLGFRQQAAQVAVGVRGVLRRAVREGTSMILEGTHLVPPFSGLMPPGAAAYEAAVMLAVPGRSEHRTRFPAREKKSPTRRAAPYLDAFQSVRWVQDDLLRLTEEHDCMVLENHDLADTITGVVEYLSHVLPLEERPSWSPRKAEAPAPLRTLMLIFDGLGDEPHPALGGKTPLAAADLPTLHQLAGAGGQGLLITIPEGVVADTAGGMTRLLSGGGEVPKNLGRGVLEALGAGLQLQQDMILFRGNLATTDAAGVVIDRRAGRIKSGQEPLLSALRELPLGGGVVGSVYPGHEHRVVVALRGQGLSAAVSDTDLKLTGRPAPAPAPLDDSPESARTSEALQRLLDIARTHLARHPVNAGRLAAGQSPVDVILTRGASAAAEVPKLTSPARPAALVSACPTTLGVARAAQMTPVRAEGMTGNVDTDLDLKFELARQLLTECSLVAIHFKGTDIAAHDKQPLTKREYLERADAALGEFLDGLGATAGDVRIVVAADHGTSSLTGNHLSDPVPLLVSRWDPLAEPSEYNEESAAQGALGLLTCAELAEMLWADASTGELVAPT